MTVQPIRAEQFLRALDTRCMPRYSVGEAARYLRESESTIRAWFFGTTYGSGASIRPFPPILRHDGDHLLSFYDVASAHVLLAFKQSNIPSPELRIIVDTLKRIFPDAAYPLLGKKFYKFHKSIVIKLRGQRIVLTKGGQLGIKGIIDLYMSRFDIDENRMPTRLYPLPTISSEHVQRRKGLIVIDPNLACGRPAVSGAGISAEVIAKRRASGESYNLLARDYRLSKRAIKEAESYFQQKAA